MKQIYRSLMKLASVFLILLTFVTAYGQETTVTGKVTDVNGLGMPGVNILKKGTTMGTTTDGDGNFSIAASNDDVLVISFIGYKTQEFAVGSKTRFDVTLLEDIETLEEVVVIGYGTANRADISSSIASVKAADFKNMPLAGIDQALQGKVSGVMITNNSGQPGGGVSIKVRGVTSVNSNDPLVVIDGVVFTNNTKPTTGFAGLGGSDGQTGNSVLATLNPNDIESVDVLKDASAQAIYGSQAANGVIIITTKKGKAGEGKLTYDVYYGQAQVTRKLDLMNLREFAEYQNAVAPIVGREPAAEFADPSLLGEGTDWQDEIFRTGKTQSHQLSFSGGKEKTNYYISVNYYNQEGILLGSDFKRYSTRFNLDHDLKKWLGVGMSTNISRSNQNVTLADAAEGTIWWAAVQSPLIPVKNIDGTWGGGNTISGYTYGQDNPVATSMNRGNKSVNTQAFGMVYAELKFPKNISLRNELSYSLGLNSNSAYQYAANIGPRTLQSKLIDNRNDSYYYAIRNYLNYNEKFGKHSVTATLGHDAQYSFWQAIGGSKVDLQNNILDLNAGGSTKTSWELTGGKGDWAMESYYVRAGYTYDNRYSIQGSFRTDGSSNFGPNNKWGSFPGVSVGWTVTNERFAEPIRTIASNLKFRAGYGSVGNQNLPNGAQNPPYTAGVNFWPGPVGFGQVGSASTNFLNGIPNPNLSWESVVTTNAGADVEFLDGRLGFIVDVYQKTTTKMLLFSTGPALIGVGDTWDALKAPIGNVGQMTNKGIDLSLNATIINKGDFTWKANAIYSQFKNKLDKLINQASSIDGKLYYDNYTVTHTVPGYPVGSFYGLKTDGLFRTQEELTASLPQFGYTVDETHTWLGDIRYEDVNPDGVIDARDITFIGSPLPKFTYGLTNNFSYKNFEVSIFLQGSQGAKIFNFMRWQLEKMDNPFYNQLTSVTDRYTESNPDGTLPRFTNTNINNVYMSDRYIEDGSYLRIQNVRLGYKLPRTVISKVKMNNMSVYVGAQNLHTFTKYTGYDPEVGAFNNSIKLMNVDAGRYPNPRTITVGATIEF
jgi:TonB-dependent starch-binding outer membrane protein SusC